MKTLLRWGKFNLVGAMGMMMQLAALACFNLWMHGRYLLASAAAIELTLLHNFAWHWFYTWRDRRCGVTPWHAFVQFHLTNGLVSLMGNLVLMRLLMHDARLPLLAANVVAIGCCSVLNFWLGNCWAFARKNEGKSPPRAETCRASIALTGLFFLMISTKAQAQATDSPVGTSQLPDAPLKQTAPVPATPISAYHPRASDSYFHNAGAFCGAGASTSPVATKPTLGCGIGFGLRSFDAARLHW